MLSDNEDIPYYINKIIYLLIKVDLSFFNNLFSNAACFILMAVLMYGITIIQNWDGAGSQLIYNIVLFILLAGLNFNRISVDAWLKNKRDRKSQ